MSQDGRSQSGGGGVEPAEGSSAPGPPLPISLAEPRPDHQRSGNLYVETPFRHRIVPSPKRPLTPGTLGRATDMPMVHGSSGRASQRLPFKGVGSSPVKGAGPPVLGGALGGSRTPTLVTKQPTASSLTFTKRGRSDDSDTESIICVWCGRCRCEACTTPRQPPASWLCAEKCLCSPTAIVDYASCLCCVKGALYHCGDDQEGLGGPETDRPCSCAGGHPVLRWACMAAASVPLPCLLCYWPLTGVRKLLEKCYQRCTNHGCQCPHGRGMRLTPASPEKRPLHDSP